MSCKLTINDDGITEATITRMKINGILDNIDELKFFYINEFISVIV